jgi:hypothetical protein
MLAAAVLALPSCIATVPNDLQVTKVQCFPDREGMPISDLPLPGRYPFGGSQSVFRVTVRTTRNVSAYIKRKDFGPGIMVFPCDDPKTSLGGTPPDYHYYDPSNDVTDAHGFHEYHFYFYSSYFVPRVNDVFGRKTYDLAQSPTSVCFYFRGGNETGFGYRSNVGMIPKETIQNLLASERSRWNYHYSPSAD